MDLFTWTHPSPVGNLRLVATEAGLRGLFFGRHRHAPPPLATHRRDPAPFAQARAQLDAWFAGDLTAFELELDPVGTAWQRRVWAALRTVPYGTTTTYGALAAALGAPGSARAVGLANGRNPLAIVVPCHRVVGADGGLTGYAGGVERKRTLLEHEAAVCRRRTRDPVGA
jgi:methylated-DNA-[protein]-cysteine S-methyltransferase